MKKKLIKSVCMLLSSLMLLVLILPNSNIIKVEAALSGLTRVTNFTEGVYNLRSAFTSSGNFSIDTNAGKTDPNFAIGPGTIKIGSYCQFWTTSLDSVHQKIEIISVGNGFYYLKELREGYYLGTSQGGSIYATSLISHSLAGMSTAPEWEIYRDSAGNFSFKNRFNGDILTLSTSPQNGAGLRGTPHWTGTDYQKFSATLLAIRINDLTAGTYNFRSALGNYMIDTNGGASSSVPRLWVPQPSNINQKIGVVTHSNTINLQAASSGNYLGFVPVAGEFTVAFMFFGYYIQQGMGRMYWTTYKNTDGSYTFLNNNMKVLSTTDATAYNGNVLTLSAWNGGARQKFFAIKL